MKFLRYDMGQLKRDDVVVVTLSGDSVNVRLMDPLNFSAYKSGHDHRYFGGHVTRSPHRIVVPRDGQWIVAIDRGGYAVNVQASVRVERKAGRILPPTQSARPATVVDVGRNLAEAHADSQIVVTHDVFLSHATEDTIDVARPIHDLLVERGLTVWLDEVQMKVGASLRRRIDQAVATSRYAVVVLSPAFFTKNWTQYELDGLVAREMNGEQIILPIWHNITKDELLKISPSLTDKFALSTTTMTLVEIADELAAAVRELADD